MRTWRGTASFPATSRRHRGSAPCSWSTSARRTRRRSERPRCRPGIVSSAGRLVPVWSSAVAAPSNCWRRRRRAVCRQRFHRVTVRTSRSTANRYTTRNTSLEVAPTTLRLVLLIYNFQFRSAFPPRWRNRFFQFHSFLLSPWTLTYVLDQEA